MSIEKIKEIRETIKDLHKKNILIMDIDIIYELDSQLYGKTISDDDYEKLYSEIEYAYMKLDNVDVSEIVYCALEHLDEVLHDDDFSLREEVCYYV